MKVGTLSLNINTDDLNYGAMLHSWAFLEILKRCEPVESAEIINYITPKLESFDRTSPALSYIRIHKWKSAIKSIIAADSYGKRLRKFNQFVADQVKVSEQFYTQQKLLASELEYDCLICESDVIWSPHFFEGRFDEVFFLAAENMKRKKKIIYAASTANADFTRENSNSFSSLIQHPDFISCRETYGTELIHECGRKDAITVLDPVLLLEAQDYEKICARRLIAKDYVLVYVPLGYDSRYQRAAHEYAKEHGLEVVEISYYVWNNLKHKVIADAGIEDFLSLVKYADAIFTNSFHAVCFSCLFHRQFYAFERKTGRKTMDLCSRLGVSDHYMKIENFHECASIDFSKVDALINSEKHISLSWLENALRA